eukprot:Rmarinus@m.15497
MASISRAALVVSASELDNIHRLAAGSPPPASNTEDDERYSKSMARLQSWGNTIEALREKKARERQKRIEQEEERRAEIDRKEAEYRAEQRRKAIERANKLLYEQSEQMKQFKSAMLHSNVLKERDMQVAYKNMSAGVDRHTDQELMQWLIDQDKKAVVAEEEASRRSRDKAKALAEEHRAHMRALVSGHREARARAKEEGRLIAEASNRAIQEEREAAIRRRQELSEMRNQAYKDDLQGKLDRDKNLNDRDLKEADDRRRYLEQKEEISKRIEEVRQQQRVYKDRKRQILLKRQTRALRKKSQQEEEYVQREVDRADAERERKLAEEAEQRRKDWDKICKSRTQQLARKDRLHKEAVENDRVMAEQWQDRIAEMKKEEAEEKEAIRQKNIDVQHYIFKQVHEKEARVLSKKEQEAKELSETKALLRREKETYANYTNAIIDEYDSRGLNTKPMKLVLRKQEKGNNLVC